MFRRAGWLRAAVALFASVAAAQEMPVPMQTQVGLFVRVLRYDHNLPRADGALVVGVLHQSKLRESASAAREAAMAFAGQGRIADLPTTVVQLDLDDRVVSADLERALVSGKVDVLYVCPLRAFDVAAITRATRAHAVLTLTGVPAYAERGLSVALGLVGERPQIIVNLAASRAEGSDLASELLRLSRIIE